MKHNRFDLLKKEIAKIIKDSPIGWDSVHSQKVCYWLLQLKPDADEILQIAALAHDIERGVTGISEMTHLKDYGSIQAFKKAHAIRSADIIGALLAKYDYDAEDIARVKKLVSHHEEGGDEETNFLMNADSIAFFEYNLEPTYNRNLIEHHDEALQRTKTKVSFMADRMSPQAKEIIKRFTYTIPEIERLMKEI